MHRAQIHQVAQLQCVLGSWKMKGWIRCSFEVSPSHSMIPLQGNLILHGTILFTCLMLYYTFQNQIINIIWALLLKE